MIAARCCGMILIGALGSILAAEAAEDRITGPVSDTAAAVLAHSVRPEARFAADRGAIDADSQITGVTLVFATSDVQQQNLDRLLEAQRDPASPDYRNWLSPEQYGERFGLSPHDIGLVTSWLERQGLTVERVARSRTWIMFGGTAARLERAFHTELHNLELAGQPHFANIAPIFLPAALSGVVGDVRGLNDFRPTPLHVRTIAHPQMDGSGGAHSLAPGDFATIYDVQPLYNAGYDGTGQTLAIAGQTDIGLTDLRAFRAQFGLPAKDPVLTLVGSDPGSNTDDQTEATLDLEWSGAVARNATVIYVYSRNVFTSLQYAIDENLAPVVSMSYGGCELESSTSYRSLAQQGNSQGITWLNASGDSGAAGCDEAGEPAAKNGLAAGFPADIPEVTAVGGTEFNEGSGFYWQAQNNANQASAVSYIPEKAWDDSALGQGIAAGGGAPSQIFSKPWWQNGVGVPNDQARDVPDVALSASGAHDPYVIWFKGQLDAIGGTSAASPSFAGIVSILNQYLLAKSAIAKPGLGNINPVLYNLAQNSAGIFHDIVAGNNDVPCSAGSKGCVNGSLGYSATAGYDIATGLGSVDAYNLVTHWAGAPALAGTSLTLTAAPASIQSGGTVQLTATLTVLSGSSAPAGSVMFAAGSTQLGSAALSGSGASETATLSVKGTALAAGANSIVASYPGSASFSASTASVTVTVAGASAVTPVATSIVVSANPASIAQNASTLLTAVVKAASGAALPTGTVGFSSGKLSLGTAALAGGTATLTLSAANLAVGVNTITASYVPIGNFGASTGAATVSVTASAIATTTTLTATPLTITVTGTTQITVAVKASAGTALPSGSVTFFLGNTNLGVVPLTNGAVTVLAPGTILRSGANSIVASYSGNSNFAASTSAPVTITVQTPVATTTTVAASPVSISQSASTLLTATVKATQGTAGPSGAVLFEVGNVILGTVPLTASGTASTAALTLKGAGLAVGQNLVTAVYGASGNFSSSTGTVIVNVIAPAIATTLTATAAPGAQSSTTVFTATVKAAGGGAPPTGIVSFALGTKLLGTATLTANGSAAAGSLILNNSIFAPGINTVTVTYSGASGFSSSAATVIISR